jgi:hypothetical protein
MGAMIRIAITVEAFDAICATLPVGSVAYEAETNAKGERLIWLERVWAGVCGPTSLPPYAAPARATATSSCGSWRGG